MYCIREDWAISSDMTWDSDAYGRPTPLFTEMVNQHRCIQPSVLLHDRNKWQQTEKQNLFYSKWRIMRKEAAWAIMSFNTMILNLTFEYEGYMRWNTLKNDTCTVSQKQVLISLLYRASLIKSLSVKKKVSLLSKSETSETFFVLLVLEGETGARSCIMSHTRQVDSMCDKCVLLNTVCSLTVLLQSMHHESHPIFCDKYPAQTVVCK